MPKVIINPPTVACIAFLPMRGLNGAPPSWPDCGFSVLETPKGKAKKKQNHQDKTKTTTIEAIDIFNPPTR